jgi:hypothetical protein
MTFWMETLTILKKKLKYHSKNVQIYEVIPIELFVNMKKNHRIVEIDHKIKLKN